MPYDGKSLHDDLAVVEFRNSREPSSLRNYQPEHLLPPGAQHFGPEEIEQSLKDHIGRSVGGRGCLCDHDQHGPDRAEHDLLEQVLLVVEEKVDSALCDPGLLRDVFEACCCESARGEHLESGAQDSELALLRCLLTSANPFFLSGDCHHGSSIF